MRNGCKVVDADTHQMEPPTMWETHIDPRFTERAPRPSGSTRDQRWRSRASR